MATCNEIALAIWVKDEPVQGGLLRLSDITSPRRELSEYRQGELVKALCRGLKGQYECLLARVGDKSETAAFKLLFVGSKFIQLLEEFGLSQNIASEKQVKHVQSAEKVIDKEPVVPVEEADNAIQPAISKNAKTKGKRKNPSPKKRANSNQLVQIANELELTELQNSVSSAHEVDEGSAEAPTFHLVTPVKRKCVGSVVRGGLMALEHDNRIDSSPLKGKPDNSSCACKEDVERLSKEVERVSKVCATYEQEFNSTWYWINNLYNSSSNQKVFHTNSHLQMLNESPQQGKQLSTPSSPQQWQLSTPSTSTDAFLPHDQLLSTPSSSMSTEVHPLQPTPSSTCPTTYAGYTKSQLVDDIADLGFEDYPKAAKRLFRRLYKNEEWQGPTLTGARANSKYDGRPAIEDLSKMHIIYEIMKDKYRVVTPVQVREKLQDLLKPSKLKIKGKFDI